MIGSGEVDMIGMVVLWGRIIILELVCMIGEYDRCE